MNCRRPLSTILCVLVLLPAALPAAAQPASSADWIAHARDDLGRFWLDPRYHGDPPGSFPTFICRNGEVWDPDAPCPSLAEAPEWIAGELGRQYIRMVSRQTYTYGVVFHLTGDPEALALCRAGTRHIMDRAWDPETGSVATWLAAGVPGPEPAARTTQSLAYALLGPAFLHYLTGDEEVLRFILAVKEHIFADYWSGEWEMLRWANAAGGEDNRDRIELVSQLDQINAYMLLTIPLLPDGVRAEWEADLRRLVAAMLRDFHDAENQRFHGYLHDPSGREWGERHNDFGHTVKAYWMLERAGRLLGEEGWVELAEAGLADVLDDALVRRNVADAPPWQVESVRPAADADGFYHVWSNQPDGIGIAWWEWCELDQAAATLALRDPRWAEHLARTEPTFFAALVDDWSGAVLFFPGATQGPRAHHWFNGYHAAEHALVGAITAAFRADEPVTLHFAPEDAGHPVSAYYVAAEEVARRTGGTGTVAVEFAGP
jgi:hypothetical protein